MHTEDGKRGVIPMKNVYSDPDSAAFGVEENIERANLTGISILDEAILIPVTLYKLFPLKPEYWTHEALFQYDLPRRFYLFLEIAKHPEFFYVLVTPSKVDDSGEVLTDAALPLRDPEDDLTLEQFMYHSDLPVDERATDAAIYAMSKPKKFNWRTREISEVNKDPETQYN